MENGKFLERCRTCTSVNKEQYYNLFYSIEIPTEQLGEMRRELRKNFNVKISQNDGLPHLICSACYKLIIDILNFKENCYKAQNILRELKDSLLPDSMEDDLKNLDKDIAALIREKLLIYRKDLNQSDKLKVVFVEETEGNETERLEKKLTFVGSNALPDTIVINPNNSDDMKSQDVIPVNMHNEINSETVPLNNIDNKSSADDDFDDTIFFDTDSSSSDSTDDEEYFNINLTNHINVPVVKNSNSSKNRKNKLVCRYCSYGPESEIPVYDNKTLLQEHISLKHSTNRPYLCHLCDRTYKDSSNRSAHLRLKHKKSDVLCQYCGKLCCITRLKTHIAQSHAFDNYICEICGAIFENISKTAFVYHKRWHNPDIQHKCEFCNKSFLQKHHLVQHLLTHNPDRVTCDICQKVMRSPTILKHHREMVHSNLHARKCLYCDQRFKSAKGRINHMKFVHSHTIKRRTRLICPICNKEVMSPNVLEIHINTVHANKIQQSIKSDVLLSIH